MKKRLIILCAALLLIMGISIVSSSTAAFASPVQASVQHSTITLAQEVQKFQRDELLLKPHVHLNAQNGMVSLDIQNGRSIGMDQKTFAFFAQGVREYNAAIHGVKNSPLAISPPSTLRSLSPPSVVPSFNCFANTYLINRGGGNFTLYLSECETIAIEIALAVVGGGLLVVAAALVGVFIILLPESAVPLGYLVAAFGVSGGLIAIGASILAFVDLINGNNGIYINFHLGSGRTSFTGWGGR